jgi:uroporphyrin-III C-methyltransferase
MATGRVSLVGAGPGDPGLWTVRALQRVQAADLVLYDALVDASALRQLTSARCFCVGKRAGRASVKQETIHRLMVRAAQRGQQVVRLKGGDPFVFGRGAEEARALALAGIPCEVVPGVTTAVAAAELAGIPVTYRGVASGFLVLSGHAGEAFDEMPLEETLRGVLPGSVTLVVMMGLDVRDEVVASLISHGWQGQTPAAIVCGASTPAAWTWTGTLRQLPSAVPPDGVPGVLVIGDVIRVRQADQGTDGVKYGSH